MAQNGCDELVTLCDGLFELSGNLRPPFEVPPHAELHRPKGGVPKPHLEEGLSVEVQGAKDRHRGPPLSRTFAQRLRSCSAKRFPLRVRASIPFHHLSNKRGGHSTSSSGSPKPWGGPRTRCG